MEEEEGDGKKRRMLGRSENEEVTQIIIIIMFNSIELMRVTNNFTTIMQNIITICIPENDGLGMKLHQQQKR